MKKIIFLLIFLSLITPIIAKEVNLHNQYIEINIEVNDKLPYVTSIYDAKNWVEYIPNCQYDTPMWTFSCIKDKDYSSTPYFLTGADAKSMEYLTNSQKAQITWVNVKKPEMTESFNVTCTINLENENSYWHINISKNDTYGVTEVTFPRIDNIYTKYTNTMIPFRGGRFYKDFDSHVRFPMNAYFNLISITKGDSTLYLSPEDEKSYTKFANIKSSDSLNTLFEIKSDVEHYGEAGYRYNQPYKFHIATITGDWYDAAKRFRKWGIKHNFGVFANGRLDERKDVPKWWLENTAWFTWDAPNRDTEPESIMEAYKLLGVPCAIQVYLWPKYHMDTHYPNFLPAVDNFGEDLKKFQDAGLKILPYTNGYLVDTAGAPVYKELGDALVIKNEKGDTKYISEWDIAGSKNAVACIGSKAYYDFLVKELCEIEKEYGVDGFYIDQVGSSPYSLCFNKDHEHPAGGGDWWVVNYRDLVKEIKEKCGAIKGEPIVLATEDSSDSYNFDGWLRCNDPFISNTDSPVNTVIYSGYAISFGDRIYPEELETDEALPAVNKLAVNLTKGIQPGWTIGRRNELTKYPKIGEYYPTMAKARYKAYEYFNLGEMVRNVIIANSIPKVHLIYKSFLETESKDFPVVRTCSYNYKDKACVVFTNISDKTQEIKWLSSPKDLNLKQKRSYNITALYPEGKTKKVNHIGDTFNIKPYGTVVFEIE